MRIEAGGCGGTRGGLAEDAAAEAADEERRDARAAHHRHLASIHAISAARGYPIGIRSVGPGAPVCRRRRRRRRRGLLGFCFPLLSLRHGGDWLLPHRLTAVRGLLRPFSVEKWLLCTRSLDQNWVTSSIFISLFLF